MGVFLHLAPASIRVLQVIFFFIPCVLEKSQSSIWCSLKFGSSKHPSVTSHLLIYTLCLGGKPIQYLVQFEVWLQQASECYKSSPSNSYPVPWKKQFKICCSLKQASECYKPSPSLYPVSWRKPIQYLVQFEV